MRSSKGRYYSEYRHSAHDLQRTLMAVNAVSWLLADAPGDARYLVDSTLPVISQLLGASAVVLVSDHPGLGDTRVCVPSLHPRGSRQLPDRIAEQLVTEAEGLLEGLPPTGVLRAVPQLHCSLLLAPLPRSGLSGGYVAAAVPVRSRPDSTDLAILGTLANQLAGAIESSHRLAESERAQQAAATALAVADEQARVLARRNELLRRTRHELVGAREGQVLARERQRIARDLHDSVAQHVLSMGMQVEWCRTSSTEPGVVERLTDVKELARSTVDRIRQTIFELSSGDDLDLHGLGAALQRLGEQHRVHGLDIAIDVTGTAVPLPGQAERALYMTVKEALFNTVVHAEASCVEVHLHYRPDAVAAHVTDDGQGRAADLRAWMARARHGGDGYHRGLANIQARAQLAGGELLVTDATPSGVRVEVRIPTAAAPEESP